MEHRTLDLGGPVHYLDFGGSGPPMVLVHGLGGSALNWMDAAPLLARFARVWAVDLLGHGRSPSTGRSSSVTDNAALLPRFVEQVARGPAILVGNSMGGYLAMRVAADRPDLLGGLVLVSPAVPQGFDVMDPVVLQLFATYATPGVGEEFLRDWSRTAGPEGMVDQMLTLIAHDPSRVSRAWRDAHVAETRERMETGAAVDDMLLAARSLIEGLGEMQAWRQSVDRVAAPTLVVHGAHDRLVSVVAARELARIRPEWELEVMEDCGHIPMVEDPEGVAGIVSRWLAERIERGSSPRAAGT
jgi:pimeloyl-ACP methyl ester carboxylesterase